MTRPNIRMRRRSPLVPGLSLALLVIALDQASKIYVMYDLLPNGGRVVLTDWLNIILVFNKGVSFSLFSGDSEITRWVLTGLALAIAVALIVWLSRSPGWVTTLALGGVIGGALGNAIDRIRLGAVVDFIDFHVPSWNDWHFATFNVSDAAISVGVALLLAAALFGGGESSRQTAD